MCHLKCLCVCVGVRAQGLVLPSSREVDASVVVTWPGASFVQDAHVSVRRHDSVTTVAQELKQEVVSLDQCLAKYIEPERLDRHNTWCGPSCGCVRLL